MKRLLFFVMFGLFAFAGQELPVYPANSFADLLKHQAGIVEKAMLKACNKSAGKYIAGFIIKFAENGDIIVKAITIKGGSI